jgi:ectoine hydroxylase-related dioxygenase (phytanoyl-CoA dioxygenase family)
LAIDDAKVGNGAMQVNPASHKVAQIVFHGSEPEENNVLTQTVRDAGRYEGAPVSLA